MQEVKNTIGIWKFLMSKVTLEELEKFAQELAEDENYLSVYIRQASQEQWGIGFEYRDGGHLKQSDGYIETTKDMLYRKYGAALVGWDISSKYYKVK